MSSQARAHAQETFLPRLVACAARPETPAILAVAGALTSLPRPDAYTIVLLPSLDARQMRRLLARWFPGADAAGFVLTQAMPDQAPRLDEFDDLLRLLNTHADIHGASPEEANWVAAALAVGCLGDNHLWQDLRLPSRQVLSTLIKHWFPALAMRNVHDMKWKKFFYKQLCEQEGIFVCRAPSCGVCSDYLACFGPES